MILRQYQREAVDAVYEYLRAHEDNPCVVIPTAGGKTPVMATICKEAVGRWSGRVLILAHVKELLQQTADKLHVICPEIDFGVYSAGLKRRDTNASVIVAGIQSAYKRACELDAFDLIMVDEAHLIPPEGDGMYRQFITNAKTINPNVRVIGLTATPYRMTTGEICGPENILNRICYEVGVKELILQGFLCPLRSKAGDTRADTSGLHVRGGEYVPGEVEEMMDEDLRVHSAVAEVVHETKDRQAVLIFSSGVKHGKHIVEILKRVHGIEAGFITGETPTRDRDETVARFKSGKIKFLCNVNVLTTGFDAPNIDCVVLLRPTLSPGLFYQMCGRGFRLHPGKQDCLILDFGDNVVRHGPVDLLSLNRKKKKGTGEAPAKQCPDCRAVIAAGYATCPFCGFVFPKPELKHNGEASTASVLSGEVTLTDHEVSRVEYSVHTKRNADPDTPKTMRVDYMIGFYQTISEWICFEHSGYARAKAVHWWKQRSSEPVPNSVEEAVELALDGVLAETKKITVRKVSGEKFDRIVNYELGPIPGGNPWEVTISDETLEPVLYYDDEVPF